MNRYKELLKGCGERCFCEHNKDNLKCGTLWNGDKHYCLRCIGLIEGYEMALEDVNNEVIDEFVNILADEDIKSLKKDILKLGGKNENRN